MEFVEGGLNTRTAGPLQSIELKEKMSGWREKLTDIEATYIRLFFSMHFIPLLKAGSQPSDQFQWRWGGIVELTGLRHRNRPRASQRVDVLPWSRDLHPFS